MIVSPVRNSQGKLIGASKIANDITERKRRDAQIVTLAHEAEHRTKNILATVLAAVRLSHSNTPDELKRLIEGRINALARVHTLFVEWRWKGAELHGLVTQEPYSDGRGARANYRPNRNPAGCRFVRADPDGGLYSRRSPMSP
jgi:hypothetical protein